MANIDVPGRKISFNTATHLGMNPEELAKLPPTQRLITIEDTGTPVATAPVVMQVTTLDTIDEELAVLQARVQVLVALKADIKLALSI